MMPMKDIKYVTTLHGTDITLLGGDPSFFKITKFSIEESSGITAVSQFLRDKTIEVFQTKNEIEIIPNFVPFDVSNINNEPEVRKCFAKEDEHIITHISNFRPLKRVTDIVPILKKVTNNFKIKMLMVGDGPERYKMEEQCRQEQLCESVLFLGKQENISEILSISDVVLIPSESESFGLVALEALACGIPCVSTNAGGLPEVNKNGITGYTRDVGDINGLAEAIITILSDRELAKTMGKAGRDIALNNFSAEIIVPKYIKYYEKILNSKL
jgi:N-acetyl-alpha-D-glucosaminyl L-malate synthase BshA